jgi:thiamine biosynthesis lipoprotein
VRLPPGVRLDPGGIGKGLAADMVAEEVMAAGAAGCLVSVGGDLSVRGATEAGVPWTVGVEHPLDPRREVARLALTEGGVASSSRMRRRWRTAGGWADHILDPRTGTQAPPGPVGASVVAGAAWWAEALATALLVAGPAWREVVPPGGAALVVGGDGRVEWTPELSEAVRDAG